MNVRSKLVVRALFALGSLLIAGSALSFGVGPNVNMVTGTKFPQGDPRSTKQNEPSLAPSSRNARTLLAASNDYRLVTTTTAEEQKGAKAWLQIYKSVDGGATWYSTPLGGCPNNLPECADSTGLTASLRALGPDFSADPTVRAGPFGTFFFSFIAGTRSDSADGVVAVQRFVDKNNAVQRNTDVRQVGGVSVLRPAQDPILPDKLTHIVTGKTGQFVDKPWNAADVPRPWNALKTCKLLEWTNTQPGVVSDASEEVPAFNVYVSFANFPGQGQNQHPSAYVAVSEDCGTTFSSPKKLSASLDASQGTGVAIDPLTGHVYVVWRRFGEPTGSPPKPDQIHINKSTDGGKTWLNQSIVVANNIRPYDQDATGWSFRTLDFPSLAISVKDGVSRVHVAWANRGATPALTPPNYACSTGNAADCDARIVITTSEDGGTTWSTPVHVDNSFSVQVFQPGAYPNVSSAPHSRGHQLQPALTFSAGKLLVTWIDNRLDHTEGVLVCPGGGSACSIAQRIEIREAKGNLIANCSVDTNLPEFDVLTTAQKAVLANCGGGAAAVWTSYLTDGTPGLVRRHTVDIYAAMADPEALTSNSFTSKRVSQYAYGSTVVAQTPSNDPPGTFDADKGVREIRQKEVSAPNLQMFSGGQAAFFGDYIDSIGQNIVATGDPSRPYKWNVGGTTNTDYATGGLSPVFHVAFTDNRHVIPPRTGDWKEPACNAVGPEPCVVDPSAGAGNRNQNVFSAIIADQDSLAYANANSKQLPSTVQRGFVITVENLGTSTRDYTLALPNVLPNGVTAASFDKGSIPDLRSAVVTVQPRSSATRSVWVTASGAPGTLAVTITGGSYSSPVLLHFDGDSANTTQIPFDVADIANNDLTNVTLSNAVLTNNALSNVTLSNNALTNGTLSNNALTNATLTNVTLTNAPLTNVTLTNTALATLSNVTLSNATLSNVALTNDVIDANALSNVALTNVALSNVTLSNVTLSNNALTNVTLSNNALTNATLTNATLTNATLTNAALSNATLSNNALTNNVLTNNALTNSVLTNATLTNATLTNAPLDDDPDKLASYEQANPNLAQNTTSTPASNLFSAADLDDSNFADATFTIRNRGNADTTLAIKLLLSDADCTAGTGTCTLPPGYKLQLILRKISLSPSVIAPTAPAAANRPEGGPEASLQLGLTQANALVSNVSVPVAVDPENPNLGTFLTNDPAAATLPLGAGEYAYVTLRAIGVGGTPPGTPPDPRELLRWGVKFVVVDASNNTRTRIPLIIKTLGPLTAVAGQAVNLPFNVFGGFGTVTGTAVCADSVGNPASGGACPSSATVGAFDADGNGSLAFTPPIGGTFYLLMSVSDGSTPAQNDQQLLKVVVNLAPVSIAVNTNDPRFPTSIPLGTTFDLATLLAPPPLITSPSPAPITFATDPASASVCTVTGTVLTPLAPGTCTFLIVQGATTVFQAISIASPPIPIATGALVVTADTASKAYSDPIPALGATYVLNGGTATTTPPAVCALGGVPVVTAPTANALSNAGTYPTVADTSALSQAKCTITAVNGVLHVLSLTPTFSNLSAPVIAPGSTPTAIGGNVSYGTLNFPPGPPLVSITLNGVTQTDNPTAPPSDGAFSSPFATGGLGIGSYGIAFGSPAVAPNFNAATAASMLIVEGFVATPAPMVQARSWHTATRLADGRVLIAGGFDMNGASTAAAEVYCTTAIAPCLAADVGKFKAVGNLPSKSAGHTATLLVDATPNPKVLVAGGGNSSSELFNPATSTWTAGGGMSSTRSFHTATPILNVSGRVVKVLLAGGADNAGKTLDTTLLYDVATGVFSAGPKLANARERHTAGGLADGRVLIAGGRVKAGQTYNTLASAEIYCTTAIAPCLAPDVGKFKSAAGLAGMRHSHGAIRLADGKVLVAGGQSGASDLATSELYDPASNSWSGAGLFVGARREATLSEAPDGEFLLAGGQGGATRLSSTAIYDPDPPATWFVTAPMTVPRAAHTATPLLNGTGQVVRVLIVGGIGANGKSTNTAETFQ